MNILIVGLGLIGGSLAKALCKYTDNTVYGFDADSSVMEKAIERGAIHHAAGNGTIGIADVTYVCLYPQLTVDFIRDNAESFKNGSIVTDSCGIKSQVFSEISAFESNYSFSFVGSHPMAGKEVCGFDNSEAALFDGASYIISGNENSDASLVLEDLAKKMRFGKVVRATPEEHDIMIAYTSQLPHVLACAYILNPCALKHDGFSAGSFRDVSRVARINETLWSELLESNSPALIKELDCLTDNLNMLKSRIAAHDRAGLEKLLRRGREIKDSIVQ